MNKKTVFTTPWFSIEALEYPKHGITSENPYYRIVEGDGIVVLALTPDKRIVLVRQFRPALGKYTFELPAGNTDIGESPVEAASRELYEEAGYQARKFMPLNQGMPLLSNRSTMMGFPFLAIGAIRDRTFVSKESIKVREVTMADFRTMVLKNEFSQFSGLGVVLLWLWRHQNKLFGSVR